MAIFATVVYVGINTDKFFDYEQIVDVISIEEIENEHLICREGDYLDGEICIVGKENRK